MEIKGNPEDSGSHQAWHFVGREGSVSVIVGCYILSCSLPTHQKSYYVPGTLKPLPPPLCIDHGLLNASLCQSLWRLKEEGSASPVEVGKGLRAAGIRAGPAAQPGARPGGGEHHSCRRARQGRDGPGMAHGLCGRQHPKCSGQ